MIIPSPTIDIYLERGSRRTFAAATEWPGWCRSGRDEEAAVQALVEYGPRYAQVLRGTALAFHAPADLSTFTIGERLEGSSTTDFGAPGAIPAADSRPVDENELARLQMILRASWEAFDAARAAAAGRELRKGPRGGGRELPAIVEHVVGADVAYLGRIGWKVPETGADDQEARLAEVREAILAALPAAARGELPEKGPRGGLRWPPRYFVRRVVWHVLDHAWEIEDR
jgi:hypothetical protein